jgi:hypothetical protein
MLTTKKALVAGALAAVALIALVGCASGKKNDMSGPIVGVPLNLPDHFMVAASGFGKATEPKPSEGCRNPMVDPKDKTLLGLRRSANEVGDYVVLAGQDGGIASGEKYGVTSQQLLRIDCATGKALGIVDQ